MEITSLMVWKKVLQKKKINPVQAWRCPKSFKGLMLPDFKKIWHMKVVRLSALCTGHLYGPGNIPGAFLL